MSSGKTALPPKSSSLQTSRQGLQICHGHSKPHLPIVERFARLRLRVLCIYHFERGRFPSLITHCRESQALGCQLGGLVKRFGLRSRGLRLVVQRPQLSQQIPLREAQFHPCLFPAQVRLLQLAAVRTPVPEGK